MMIRLPDFNMLSDTGAQPVEEQFFTLTNLLSTFMMRYRRTAGALPPQ